MEDYMVFKIESDSSLASYMSAQRDNDPNPWLYSAHSLGIGPQMALPKFPYIIWNEFNSVPYVAVEKEYDSRLRSFPLYVYDLPGDFSRINFILKEVRRIVKAMAPFMLPDGTRCSDSKWGGESANLPSDEYRAITRFGIARFTVNQ